MAFVPIELRKLWIHGSRLKVGRVFLLYLRARSCFALDVCVPGTCSLTYERGVKTIMADKRLHAIKWRPDLLQLCCSACTGQYQRALPGQSRCFQTLDD